MNYTAEVPDPDAAGAVRHRHSAGLRGFHAAGAVGRRAGARAGPGHGRAARGVAAAADPRGAGGGLPAVPAAAAAGFLLAATFRPRCGG